MDAAVVGDAEVGGGTAELLVEGSFEELLAGNSETVSSLFCRASVTDRPDHYRVLDFPRPTVIVSSICGGGGGEGAPGAASPRSCALARSGNLPGSVPATSAVALARSGSSR